MRKLSMSKSLTLICASLCLVFIVETEALAQSDKPVIVQPGAPGVETKVLPSNTSASLPPITKQDIEFMQGMIMHHAQAVEMTALIAERTKHEGITGLGARISQTQAEEIKFMERWLKTRGQKTTMSGMGEMKDMKGMKGKMDHKHSGHGGHQMAMPGMLTPKQMEALKNAKGAKFDELFLKGMIQHHIGALVMVDELFKTQGSGQDAELFTFATDVDSTQRAEIKLMETMLKKNP